MQDVLGMATANKKYRRHPGKVETHRHRCGQTRITHGMGTSVEVAKSMSHHNGGGNQVPSRGYTYQRMKRQWYVYKQDGAGSEEDRQDTGYTTLLRGSFCKERPFVDCTGWRVEAISAWTAVRCM